MFVTSLPTSTMLTSLASSLAYVHEPVQLLDLGLCLQSELENLQAANQELTEK
jgi:hypothetical protein